MRPAPSAAPSHTVSPCAGGAGQGSARGIDARGEAVERLVFEEACDVAAQSTRIRDLGVAHQEGLLGRLHQAMQVVESGAVGGAPARIEREQQQGSETLGRRRMVVQHVAVELDAERRHPPRAVGSQVGGADRAAGAGKILGERGAELTAIEVVEAHASEMPERVGEPRLAKACARGGRRAVHQPVRGKACNVAQLGELGPQVVRLRDADRDAVARVLHGVLE